MYLKVVTPRVEYEITPLGKSLHPIFKSVCDWATEHMAAVEKARIGAAQKRPRVAASGVPGVRRE